MSKVHSIDAGEQDDIELGGRISVQLMARQSTDGQTGQVADGETEGHEIAGKRPDVVRRAAC